MSVTTIRGTRSNNNRTGPCHRCSTVDKLTTIMVRTPYDQPLERHLCHGCMVEFRLWFLHPKEKT